MLEKRTNRKKALNDKLTELRSELKLEFVKIIDERKNTIMGNLDELRQ